MAKANSRLAGTIFFGHFAVPCLAVCAQGAGFVLQCVSGVVQCVGSAVG